MEVESISIELTADKKLVKVTSVKGTDYIIPSEFKSKTRDYNKTIGINLKEEDVDIFIENNIEYMV